MEANICGRERVRFTVSQRNCQLPRVYCSLSVQVLMLETVPLRLDQVREVSEHLFHHLSALQPLT